MNAPSSRCRSASGGLKTTRPSSVPLLPALLAAAVLGFPAPAGASPEYPADIEAYWGHLSRLPVSGMGCKLCHSSDQGLTGTVVQPFGKTMRAQGLQPANPASLYAALKYVGEHSVLEPIVDSDGDGVPDYTEVALDFTNPNDPSDFKQHATGGGNTSSDGGAGGDFGQGESGGQGPSEGPPPEVPVFGPSSPGDLPPRFVHGCALEPRTGGSGAALTALLAVAAVLQRRTRRRSRPHR
jgi:MYXO-CTERM domain-containing protein